MSLQRSNTKITLPKPPNPTALLSRSLSASTLSSHLAMVELKQRILTSISKLSDRDTYQIAVEDLEKIIQTVTNDGVSMLLNCLYDAVNDPNKPAVKKEGLRLLGSVCEARTEASATHLTKIISCVVKRLKDSDSQVRDGCRDAIGTLARLYLKGGSGGDGVVSLFVKPLFEVMSENNKAAQAGAAMSLAKMVECASDPPLSTFQKLCSRVCKYLNSSSFMAKASLLHVVSSLSQIGAIAPQSFEPLLQTINECLASSDWATRKAAADSLAVLSLNTKITAEAAATTLNVLETCRFDKVKPVRESMNEALQLWKKIAAKGDGSSDGNTSADASDKKDLTNRDDRGSDKKDSSNGSSLTDPNSKGKGNIYDKAVGILKKKELNPEFFQKLEARCSSVEVIVPRRCVNTSNSQNGDGSQPNDADSSGRASMNCHDGDGPSIEKYENMQRGTIEHSNQRESSSIFQEFSRNHPGQSDGLLNNKGNWLAIQRQLSQMERQQTYLMNMLQEFMGGSHEGMLTLENRVRGLERVVEDMARDLSISTSRRGNNVIGFEGSSNRPLNKYNSFNDYSTSVKMGRTNDGRTTHFGERFSAFDGIAPGMKSRGPSWRPDASDSWDFNTYSKNGQVAPRRALEKGGAVRFGEGPSARSVWQASKDEATLEAIRGVPGDDNGVTRNPRVAIPEMTAEALGDDGIVQERDPVWNSWSNAMDALHGGDIDSAFAEVLNTGDDLLLAKLMDKSGPIFDQLSNEVATEVVNAVSEFLLEQNLFEMCLYWVQQLTDIVMETGPDALGIPMEIKREILLNLNEASSLFDLPDDWEMSSPDQILRHLASAWEIDLKRLGR